MTHRKNVFRSFKYERYSVKSEFGHNQPLKTSFGVLFTELFMIDILLVIVDKFVCSKI